jgi:hypothetical protein
MILPGHRAEASSECVDHRSERLIHRMSPGHGSSLVTPPAPELPGCAAHSCSNGSTSSQAQSRCSSRSSASPPTRMGAMPLYCVLRPSPNQSTPATRYCQ